MIAQILKDALRAWRLHDQPAGVTYRGVPV